VLSIVVPFRAAGKTRLPGELREDLARAMLGDVIAAALEVGRVLVVGDAAERVSENVEVVDDPGGGQGAAVGACLGLTEGHALVVNADLPCATPEALLRLAAAGPALVAAADGTTNALSLPDPSSFAPVYGPGSAARFARLGLLPVSIAELEHDVDTVADLVGLPSPPGPRTRLVTDRYLAASASQR
jgi:2-phospho-L-lactate guanylyltransferase (CobY/MobA/RfbA family)